MKIPYKFCLLIAIVSLTACDRKPKIIYLYPPQQHPSLQEQRAFDRFYREPEYRLFAPIRLDGWPYIPEQKRKVTDCEKKTNLLKKRRAQETANVVYVSPQSGTGVTVVSRAEAHGQNARAKASVNVLVRKKRSS